MFSSFIFIGIIEFISAILLFSVCLTSFFFYSFVPPLLPFLLNTLLDTILIPLLFFSFFELCLSGFSRNDNMHFITIYLKITDFILVKCRTSFLRISFPLFVLLSYIYTHTCYKLKGVWMDG